MTSGRRLPRAPWNAAEHSATCTNLELEYQSAGKEAECAPDPRFPHGVALDISLPGGLSCSRLLPYPAAGVGSWLMRCSICGYSAAVTAAGRADDPRSVRVPCKLGGQA